ncbi:protein translocase subunit secY/sec61 alpha [Thermosporothrix hazakensis]|jgi:preprotein translocase subunit SecY|uniref:Protein translocase subunit SecY n=2 Tax=Thermosporothrix TaxID=768650 RepID=A0A326UCK6_THEHA|nr:preprotein translocase subunit SecY [Thermosporothrix hazakensis]PZW23291.1 protein translocase subunit secY/sec61 alpha [Thermosporothrix hazakensis]BBH89596.1 protein translocase subunit SecY [Thermosporothrix sp. COM3]GCE47782.1 protein translocase subunit SecY [Thermosporothrix hazakensis]
MWEKLRSIWTVPDLRNKILFTLGMLILCRVLAHITIPLTGEERTALVALFQGKTDPNLGQLLGLLDIFSGGSLQTFSIVALSVYPYITATIVMQLLQPIIPALQNLASQGEAGRLRFSQITRWVTVPLAFLQAVGQCALYQQQNVLKHFSLVDPQYALQSYSILFSLTAGVLVLVWFGELITEKGIGNGISIVIFGNIVSRIPNTVHQGYVSATSSGGNGSGIVSIGIFVLIALVTLVAIVYIYLGQRRIPVQYPTKRMVGRGLLVGSAQTTYIPMQVNSAGMIPLIFAQSMMLFPAVISKFLTTSSITWLKDASIWVSTWLVNPGLWYYWLIYGLLVVAFTYFYAYVMWQQQNIPENLQKQGAFIPGYRPGQPTSDYLYAILNRITLGGALFLGIIAVLPFIANVGGSQLLGTASLLIVVGVVLDTVRQLESQMVMRNYSGFLS